MRKRLNLYLIMAIIPLMILAAPVSAKDGANVTLSSGDDTVVIGKDGVTISSGDGSEVKTDDKGVNINADADKEGSSGAKGSVASGTLELNDDATISGRNIVSDGDGIILKGNGDYTLVDCKITAAKNAIVVKGNATVMIKNCVINGKKSALLIKGNGTVKATGNVINGKIKNQGNADYTDLGGNVVNS